MILSTSISGGHNFTKKILFRMSLLVDLYHEIKRYHSHHHCFLSLCTQSRSFISHTFNLKQQKAQKISMQTIPKAYNQESIPINHNKMDHIKRWRSSVFLSRYNNMADNIRAASGKVKIFLLRCVILSYVLLHCLNVSFVVF